MTVSTQSKQGDENNVNANPHFSASGPQSVLCPSTCDIRCMVGLQLRHCSDRCSFNLSEHPPSSIEALFPLPFQPPPSSCSSSSVPPFSFPRLPIFSVPLRPSSPILQLLSRSQVLRFARFINIVKSTLLSFALPIITNFTASTPFVRPAPSPQ